MTAFIEAVAALTRTQGGIALLLFITLAAAIGGFLQEGPEQ